MQALTNDNYSEIKLYSVFHIEYKAIEFSTNKKRTNHYIPDPNIGTTTRQPLIMAADRPLSRRLDRCDRVIQDEVGDSNGGNV